MLDLNQPGDKKRLNHKILGHNHRIEQGILLTAVNAPNVMEAILKHVVESRVSLKPVFIAVEIAQKVRSTLSELIGDEKKPVTHKPQRLDSPVDNGTFQANIETGEQSPYEKAIHYIIGCSRYEDEIVSRFLSKLTMADRCTNLTIESLTPDTIDGCEFEVRRVDDVFEQIPWDDILKDAENPDKKVVVSLAGIQTNQYPRALYIAAKIRAEAIKRGLDKKIDILFGGFHIRGDEPSREELQEHGFTAVNGEAENGRLGAILTDCVHDRVKPLYEWKDAMGRDERVELQGSPLIKPLKEHIDRFNPYQTLPIQFSRGCPWGCEFCAVRGIDGPKIRARTPEEVRVLLEHMAKEGITKIVISDDNFYRHPNKDAILDLFIGLKQQGAKFDIIIQTDLKVLKKDKDTDTETIDTEFIDKCAEAGVNVIFCGTESFDYEVLRELGKAQNMGKDQKGTEEKMRLQREAWNQREIGVLYPFIIGNEKDKPGVGKRSAEAALRIGANVIVPLIRMILPGAKDSEKLRDGSIAHIDPDWGKYVGGDPVVTWANPESLTPEQVEKEYWDLIQTFYRPENIPQTCFSLSILRHFCWMMIIARMGQKNIMDNGIGKPVLFRERFDKSEHEDNMGICKQKKSRANSATKCQTTKMK